MRATIAALAILLAVGCGSTNGNGTKPDPADGGQSEQDAKLDASLEPMVTGVALHAMGKRLCLQGFYDAAAKSEIRMSDYVSSRVLDAMVAKGVSIVERADLDRVIKEQMTSASDLFSAEAQKNIGQLAGADLVLLCPVTRPSKRAYRVHWKLVDVGSGEVLASGECTIDRRHLPVKYGGAI
ncbi:MAG: hypothetical protein ACYTDY_09260 [Planctomycetota bacterium]